MEAATKGKAHSEGLVKEAVGKGRMTQDEGAALLALITPEAGYEDLRDATSSSRRCSRTATSRRR